MKMYARRFRVDVTRSHIQHGRKATMHSEKCSTHCPLALAIKEAVYFWPVRVFYRDVKLAGLAARLPRAATKFIACLESGERIRPFSFTLTVT